MIGMIYTLLKQNLNLQKFNKKTKKQLRADFLCYILFRN